MSTPAITFDLPNLLTRAGAKLLGRNRADCPHCHGKRSVSYTGEVFNCFRAECDFRGNAFSLARSLGLLPTVTADEMRAFGRVRDQAHLAATIFLSKIRGRRFKLHENHRTLLNIYYGSVERLKRNLEDETAWGALAYTYREMPRVRAELLFWEDAPVADRLAFLNATRKEQQTKLEGLLMAFMMTGE